MGKLTFMAALALAAASATAQVPSSRDQRKIAEAPVAPVLSAANQDPKKALDKAGEMRPAGAKHDVDVKAAQKGDGQAAAPKAAAPKAAAPKAATPEKVAASKTVKPKAAAPKEGAKKGTTKSAKVAEPKAPEKRDPFIPPMKKQDPNAPPVILPAGNLGLVVGQANLVGVAKSPKGMIAMVAGPNGKTYFLKENDKVYNGRVAKITADSMVFEETVIDPIGRTSQREVIKKLSTTEAK